MPDRELLSILVLRLINAILLVAGLAVLAWMVGRIGPEALAAAAADIGWTFAAVLGIHFASLLACAYTLQLAVGPPLSLLAALGIELAGHAVNEATPMAKLGELTKYGLLRERVEVERAAAGLIVWNIALFLAAAIAVSISCLVALATFDVAAAARPVLIAAAAVFAALFAGALLLLLFRVGSWPLALLERLGVSTARVDRWRERWRRVEDAWADVARDRRRLAGLLAGGLAIRAINVAEGAAILAALGVEPLWASALAAYASFQIAYWITSFVPLQAGTAEGGAYATFVAMGLSGASGVVLELTRKLRRLTFIAIGLAILALGLARPKKHDRRMLG